MLKRLRSIWKYTCPRCHQGDLFKKPFMIAKPLDMPDSCAVCKQNFQPEPGYYFGALFISYGLTAILFLLIAGTSLIFVGLTVNQTMALIIFTFAITYFKAMRLSRSIWIHIDIKKDKNLAGNR